MKSYRKLLVASFKLAITGGVLFFILRQVDLAEILQVVMSGDGFLIALAILCQFIAFMLSSYRWWLLLRYANVQCSYRAIAPSYYLGLFCNNFLPLGIGGDAVRTVHLAMAGYDAKALISSAIVDRMVGVCVIVAMGSVALLFVADQLPISYDALSALIIIALMASGWWVVFSNRFAQWMEKIGGSYRQITIVRILFDIYRICHAYRKDPLRLLIAAAISVVLQAMVCVCYFLLGVSIGLNLDLVWYFAIVPVVVLASNLPISLGGLGIREGVLVALLLMLAVATPKAISLSLLYLALLWFVTLPGGLVWLANQHKKPIPQKS